MNQPDKSQKYYRYVVEKPNFSWPQPKNKNGKHRLPLS
jgi:hypothetical protein